jgi:hypothetical protein
MKVGIIFVLLALNFSQIFAQKITSKVVLAKNIELIAVIENLFHSYRETKGIETALKLFFETRNFNHFLAAISCVSVVFLIHNIFQEIDQYLGKGNLLKLFFKREKR